MVSHISQSPRATLAKNTSMFLAFVAINFIGWHLIVLTSRMQGDTWKVSMIMVLFIFLMVPWVIYPILIAESFFPTKWNKAIKIINRECADDWSDDLSPKASVKVTLRRLAAKTSAMDRICGCATEASVAKLRFEKLFKAAQTIGYLPEDMKYDTFFEQ